MQIMKTPRSIDIALTHKCNLRCSYCSHFSSSLDVKNDLPVSEWLNFFEELNRCSVMNVCLQGGEPFCFEDFPTIIEGIVKNRMRFNILSNGTLISDRLANLIAKTNRCDGVQISIDGSDSDIHDSFRGKGSFNKAIQGIETLRKSSVYASVRVTIHKKNVYHLEKIAKFLLEDMKLPSFSTNAASHMGLCRSNEDMVQLSANDINYALETLSVLNKKYQGRITGEAGPIANIRHWQKMEDAKQNKEKSFHNCGYLSGCNCVMSNLSVRADGVIVPCIQLAHMELGKINVDSLETIWNENSSLNKFRERNKIPLTNFEFCKDCEYIPYCTGNCPALSYTVFKDEFHPSPDGCLKRFLEQGGKLPQKTIEIK